MADGAVDVLASFAGTVSMRVMQVAFVSDGMALTATWSGCIVIRGRMACLASRRQGPGIRAPHLRIRRSRINHAAGGTVPVRPATYRIMGIM